MMQTVRMMTRSPLICLILLLASIVKYGVLIRNELCGSKHCWGVNERNSIVISVTGQPNERSLLVKWIKNVLLSDWNLGKLSLVLETLRQTYTYLSYLRSRNNVEMLFLPWVLPKGPTVHTCDEVVLTFEIDGHIW